MRLSWREQLKKYPSLADMQKWPSINIEKIKKGYRKKFIRNKSIVFAVLSGSSVSQVSKAFSISSGMVTTIMNRCLASDVGASPALTAGLIPHNRIQESRRKKQLSKIGSPAGGRCSFSYLLDNVPGLKEGLDKVIRANLDNKKYSQNLTPASFHSEFLRLLSDAGWSQNDYPYTEEKQGYETVRQYFHLLKDQCLMEKELRAAKDIEILNYQNSSIAMREVQIDEQCCDALTSAMLVIDNFSSAIRLSRLSLILSIDVDTNCIISYELPLTRNPSQEDVSKCAQSIYKPWKPRQLTTPGLDYMPGAGFPSGSVDDFSSLAIEEFNLDNALSHHALSIRSLACDTMGSTFKCGRPKIPKERNWIEYAIRPASDIVHRFESTSGSHVRDPKKESAKNSKTPPLLSLRVLEDCLDVVLANHNATPKAHLGGYSPLELIREHMETKRIRYLPQHISKSIQDLSHTQTATVRWLKHEHRLPHISFYGVRYQGKALGDTELVNKSVIVKYLLEDIRTLEVYTNTGEYVGKIYAPRSWQKFPHSIKTRKVVQKFVKKFRRSMTDPLSGYFAYLLKHKDIPSEALEIVRVYREFSAATTHITLSETEDGRSVSGEIFNPRRDASKQRFPDWTPEFSRIPSK